MSNRNRAKKNVDSEMGDAENSSLFVSSIARAFSVLESFSGIPEARSLAQIAELTGLDRSAIQRIAFTLTTLGYLERTSRGLVPGPKLLDRACDYLRGNALI